MAVFYHANGKSRNLVSEKTDFLHVSDLSCVIARSHSSTKVESMNARLCWGCSCVLSAGEFSILCSCCYRR